MRSTSTATFLSSTILLLASRSGSAQTIKRPGPGALAVEVTAGTYVTNLLQCHEHSPVCPASYEPSCYTFAWNSSSLISDGVRAAIGAENIDKLLQVGGRNRNCRRNVGVLPVAPAVATLRKELYNWIKNGTYACHAQHLRSNLNSDSHDATPLDASHPTYESVRAVANAAPFTEIVLHKNDSKLELIDNGLTPWNGVGGNLNQVNSWDVGGCGTLKSCVGVYKKAMLVYDPNPLSCWTREHAIPVLADHTTPHDLLLKCASSLYHLLAARSPGAYVKYPFELRDAVLNARVLFTCGNTYYDKANDVTRSFPGLCPEGGTCTVLGGPASHQTPTAFVDVSSICGHDGNKTGLDQLPKYDPGGDFYGVSGVSTVWLRTILDVAISHVDPEGYYAIQRAEAIASGNQVFTRQSWMDCHTAASTYFAAGVSLVLWDIRASTAHGSNSRVDLRTQDPSLWCLVLRYFEYDNSWTSCPSPHATEKLNGIAAESASGAVRSVDCHAVLTILGIRQFGPPGDNGIAMGGSMNLTHQMPVFNNLTENGKQDRCDPESTLENQRSGPSNQTIEFTKPVIPPRLPKKTPGLHCVHLQTQAYLTTTYAAPDEDYDTCRPSGVWDARFAFKDRYGDANYYVQGVQHLIGTEGATALSKSKLAAEDGQVGFYHEAVLNRNATLYPPLYFVGCAGVKLRSLCGYYIYSGIRTGKDFGMTDAQYNNAEGKQDAVVYRQVRGSTFIDSFFGERWTVGPPPAAGLATNKFLNEQTVAGYAAAVRDRVAGAKEVKVHRHLYDLYVNATGAPITAYKGAYLTIDIYGHAGQLTYGYQKGPFEVDEAKHNATRLAISQALGVALADVYPLDSTSGRLGAGDANRPTGGGKRSLGYFMGELGIPDSYHGLVTEAMDEHTCQEDLRALMCATSLCNTARNSSSANDKGCYARCVSECTGIYPGFDIKLTLTREASWLAELAHMGIVNYADVVGGRRELAVGRGGGKNEEEAMDSLHPGKLDVLAAYFATPEQKEEYPGYAGRRTKNLKGALDGPAARNDRGGSRTQSKYIMPATGEKRGFLRRFFEDRIKLRRILAVVADGSFSSGFGAAAGTNFVAKDEDGVLQELVARDRAFLAEKYEKTMSPEKFSLLLTAVKLSRQSHHAHKRLKTTTFSRARSSLRETTTFSATPGVDPVTHTHAPNALRKLEEAKRSLAHVDKPTQKSLLHYDWRLDSLHLIEEGTLTELAHWTDREHGTNTSTLVYEVNRNRWRLSVGESESVYNKEQTKGKFTFVCTGGSVTDPCLSASLDHWVACDRGYMCNAEASPKWQLPAESERDTFAVEFAADVSAGRGNLVAKSTQKHFFNPDYYYDEVPSVDAQNTCVAKKRTSSMLHPLVTLQHSAWMFQIEECGFPGVDGLYVYSPGSVYYHSVPWKASSSSTSTQSFKRPRARSIEYGQHTGYVTSLPNSIDNDAVWGMDRIYEHVNGTAMVYYDAVLHKWLVFANLTGGINPWERKFGSFERVQGPPWHLTTALSETFASLDANPKYGYVPMVHENLHQEGVTGYEYTGKYLQGHPGLPVLYSCSSKVGYNALCKSGWQAVHQQTDGVAPPKLKMHMGPPAVEGVESWAPAANDDKAFPAIFTVTLPGHEMMCGSFAAARSGNRDPAFPSGQPQLAHAEFLSCPLAFLPGKYVRVGYPERGDGIYQGKDIPTWQLVHPALAILGVKPWLLQLEKSAAGAETYVLRMDGGKECNVVHPNTMVNDPHCSPCINNEVWRCPTDHSERTACTNSSNWHVVVHDVAGAGGAGGGQQNSGHHQPHQASFSPQLQSGSFPAIPAGSGLTAPHVPHLQPDADPAYHIFSGVWVEFYGVYVALNPGTSFGLTDVLMRDLSSSRGANGFPTDSEACSATTTNYFDCAQASNNLVLPQKYGGALFVKTVTEVNPQPAIMVYNMGNQLWELRYLLQERTCYSPVTPYPRLASPSAEFAQCVGNTHPSGKPCRCASRPARASPPVYVCFSPQKEVAPCGTGWQVPAPCDNELFRQTWGVSCAYAAQNPPRLTRVQGPRETQGQPVEEEEDTTTPAPTTTPPPTTTTENPNVLTTFTNDITMSMQFEFLQDAGQTAATLANNIMRDEAMTKALEKGFAAAIGMNETHVALTAVAPMGDLTNADNNAGSDTGGTANSTARRLESFSSSSSAVVTTYTDSATTGHFDAVVRTRHGGWNGKLSALELFLQIKQKMASARLQYLDEDYRGQLESAYYSPRRSSKQRSGNEFLYANPVLAFASKAYRKIRRALSSTDDAASRNILSLDLQFQILIVSSAKAGLSIGTSDCTQRTTEQCNALLSEAVGKIDLNVLTTQLVMAVSLSGSDLASNLIVRDVVGAPSIATQMEAVKIQTADELFASKVPERPVSKMQIAWRVTLVMQFLDCMSELELNVSPQLSTALKFAFQTSLDRIVNANQYQQVRTVVHCLTCSQIGCGFVSRQRQLQESQARKHLHVDVLLVYRSATAAYAATAALESSLAQFSENFFNDLAGLLPTGIYTVLQVDSVGPPQLGGGVVGEWTVAAGERKNGFGRSFAGGWMGALLVGSVGWLLAL